MKVLFAGDSWMYGLETSLSFKDIIIKKLNIGEVTDVSIGGASNEYIFRKSSEKLLKNNYDLLVVQWSWIGRTSVVYDNKYVTVSKNRKKFSGFTYTKPLEIIQNIIYKSSPNYDFLLHDLISVVSLNSLSKLNGVKTLNLFLPQDLLNSCKQYDICMVESSLDLITKDIPRTEQNHTNEYGHELIAKSVIEKLERM